MIVDVLCGGDSSEREGSLLSGKTIADALSAAGHTARYRDITLENISQLVYDRPQVAFQTIHGGFGEDGRLQGLLELLNVPFVGSSSKACCISQNKALFNGYVRSLGLKSPQQRIQKEIAPPAGISYPIVLKPIDQGCSYGVFYLENESQFRKHISFVTEFTPQYVVEEYIDGREFTIGLYRALDQSVAVLPIAESILVQEKKIIDFQVKYPGGEHLCKTVIHQPGGFEGYTELVRQSRHIFDSLDCSGYVRMDVRVTSRGDIYFIENNTSPGMISADESDFPKMLQAGGISLDTFCDQMVLSAIKRQTKPLRPVPDHVTMANYLGIKPVIS